MSTSTTTWYGKSPAKQLQQLLQTRPKLPQLLAVPQFIQQLKSYNPKLLQYLTNNPSIISEGIDLITVPPLESDSHERKYKLPLQVIQMIETQTTCILNSFFKQNQKGSIGLNNNKEVFLDQMFNYLTKLIPKQSSMMASSPPPLLPLLAGYFFRTCVCLINNRYKQTLQFVYSRPYIFSTLIHYSQSMPICNTLQLFINLDVNKSVGDSDSAKLQVKKQAMKKILERIELQRKFKREQSAIVIENLMTVLIQTIEKYYLIQDGKSLIDLLTSQQTIYTMLQLTKQHSQLSYPAFSFFISLINYYSFSSFNADQADEEKRVKNLARLQSQPMVSGLRAYFTTALNKIMKASIITLYEYKLLQMLCHCISISSQQLLQVIKQTKFFAQLITLLFKHPNNNILHMLIEKSFLHVFISERKIYEKYKKHLFCQIDIIEMTAGKVLKENQQTKVFEKLRKNGSFGHFMRILKIYSGIQTTQESIITAIKANTQIWNKITTFLIKPYENICFKQLGTYDNLPQGKYQQFEVSKSAQSTTINQIDSNKKPLTNSMIEQIRKEDELLPLKKQEQKSSRALLSQMAKQENKLEKRKQEQLLKSPTHNFTIDFKSHLKSNSEIKVNDTFTESNASTLSSIQQQPHRQIKKVQSFKEFMSKKKVQAQQEIRLKRSLSHEKRLSGSKGKITGMSPKKNSWTEKSDDGSQKDKDNKIRNNGSNNKMSNLAVAHSTKHPNEMPKIPHYSQNVSSSASSVSNSNINSAKQSLTQSQPPLTSNTTKSTTPTAYRSYYGGSIQTRVSTSSSPKDVQNQQFTNKNNETMSEKKLEILKKIKIIRIQAPKQKKYRNLQEKDKVLLEFLGIENK